MGEEGAGHFVKMVHNGIEYGDMQLICEAYHLMKDVLGMGHDEMAQVSARARGEAAWQEAPKSPGSPLPPAASLALHQAPVARQPASRLILWSST